MREYFRAICFGSLADLQSERCRIHQSRWLCVPRFRGVCSCHAIFRPARLTCQCDCATPAAGASPAIVPVLLQSPSDSDRRKVSFLGSWREADWKAAKMGPGTGAVISRQWAVGSHQSEDGEGFSAYSGLFVDLEEARPASFSRTSVRSPGSAQPSFRASTSAPSLLNR